MSNRILYTPREPARSRRRLIVFWTWKRIAGAVVLALVLSGLVFAFRYPEWQVKNIKFSGLSVLAQSELEEKIRGELNGSMLSVIPKSSIFAMNLAAVEEILAENFPRIKEVSVARQLPDTLLVNIVERKFKAILCNDGWTPEVGEDIECVYIDLSGYGLDRAPNSVGSLITKIKTDFSELFVGQQTLEPVFAEQIFALASKIKEKIGAEVIGYEYTLSLPREIKVSTDEGWVLIVSLESNFDEVMNVLKTVLKEEIKEKRSRVDYIDLRFGNKVFYKFR